MKRNIIIVIIIIIIYLLLISYKCYELTNNNNKISILENKLKEKSNIEATYMEIYEELESEVGSIQEEKDITNKINLLKRNISSNEEYIESIEKELENNQKQNSNLENQVRNLKQKKEEQQYNVILENKITYSQFPKYPTGCESAALYILLKYYNIDVTMENIVSNLKKGDLPYSVGSKKYGGNPEIEFIGDPKTNYSYGVYNKPIAEVANKYKPNVNSKIGLDFDKMLEIVKEKKPVMVWTTINLSKPYISNTWTYKATEEQIKWISGEHAMVVIGYNKNEIIVSDPYTGTIRYFNKEKFKERYNYLGRRAIYY